MSVNGLQKMTDRILADAQAEAERLLAEAEAEAAAISEDYARRADEIRERLSVAAEEKGAEMISRARSTAAMQKRDLLLRQRSELLESVFVGAREWVLSLDGEKYTDILAGLLASMLYETVETADRNRTMYGEEDEDAEAELEVLLNKRDRAAYGEAVLEAARKKLSGKVSPELLGRVKLASELREMDGGVVLRRGDVELNCSFEQVFGQLRRELEAEVSQTLFAPRGKKL